MFKLLGLPACMYLHYKIISFVFVCEQNPHVCVYSIKAVGFKWYVFHTANSKRYVTYNIHEQTIDIICIHACGIILCINALLKYDKV